MITLLVGDKWHIFVGLQDLPQVYSPTMYLHIVNRAIQTKPLWYFNLLGCVLVEGASGLYGNPPPTRSEFSTLLVGRRLTKFKILVF